MNDMLISAIDTFLTTPHTGVLMISGGWGTGKSYFVSKKLLPHIRNVRYGKSEIAETGNRKIPRRVASLLQRGIVDTDCYLPVMVSVFGKGSVRDLESAIMGEWLNVISGDRTTTISSLFKTLKKFAAKSKKLNDASSG